MNRLCSVRSFVTSDSKAHTISYRSHVYDTAIDGGPKQHLEGTVSCIYACMLCVHMYYLCAASMLSHTRSQPDTDLKSRSR